MLSANPRVTHDFIRNGVIDEKQRVVMPGTTVDGINDAGVVYDIAGKKGYVLPFENYYNPRWKGHRNDFALNGRKQTLLTGRIHMRIATFRKSP